MKVEKLDQRRGLVPPGLVEPAKIGGQQDVVLEDDRAGQALIQDFLIGQLVRQRAGIFAVAHREAVPGEGAGPVDLVFAGRRQPASSVDRVEESERQAERGKLRFDVAPAIGGIRQ